MLLEKERIMARIVAETPVLKGKDAKKFRIRMIETLSKKLTQIEIEDKLAEIERVKKSYDLIISISGGHF